MGKLGWGPGNRETFTMSNPADYVTFNSITDNNSLGDERNFVRVRKKGEGKFRDKLEMKKGEICTVKVFYHNNAKSSLNWKGQGFSYDTRVELGVVIDDSLKNVIGFQGIITSSNAKPQQIWDCCQIIMLEPIKLKPIMDSARIYNGTGDFPISAEDLLKAGSGTLIGISRMDGIIPGCSEYAGYVEIDFLAT